MSQRLSFLLPSLATPASSPPKGDAWVHEAKWDGYRCQVVKVGRLVRLFSKGGTEWTRRLPGLTEALAKLPARSAILDCELCFCDPTGRPRFDALMREMRRGDPDETRLALFAFDLMHLNGSDLRRLPFSERRPRLFDLASSGTIPCLFVVDQFADGHALLEWCERFGLEGVVSKRLDSPYVAGPTKAWRKVKCQAWRANNAERWRIFEGAS